MIPVLYPGTRLAPPAVVTTTGAAAGFPARRLYDGDVGLLWLDTAAGTRDVLIDQAASPLAVDTLLLGAGHNLAGVSIEVASGATSGALVTRVAGTAAAGVHRMTLAVRTDRWWRVRFVGAPVPPQVPELVLSLALPLPAPPVLRGQDVGSQANALDLESYGGYAWGLSRGPERWTATYPLLAMTAAQRDALVAAHHALDGGARHCYLTDGEGVTRWVNWTTRHLRFTALLPARYDTTLTFIEVLGAP